MSTTKTKGKQISVIVAGATGSTGRHVVSRLVSHPDVSRVVAIVRRPVPVNRWTTVFPQLNTSDALRCLSVVPLDWEKMINDVSKVPLSYVAEGVWDYNAENGLRSAAQRSMSWHQYQQLRRLRSGVDATAPQGSVAASHFGRFVQQLLGASPGWHHASHAGHKGGGGALNGTYAPPSFGNARGIAPQKRVGYVQFTRYSALSSPASSERGGNELDDKEELDIMMVGAGKSNKGGILGFNKTGTGPSSTTASSKSASASSSSSSATWNAPVDDPFYGSMSDEERVRYGKAFLQQMLQTPFYQTVFTGHHVAINCIGTSHWLSSRYLAAVDYDLSIAFAKAVRIFNCMTHAEVNEIEDEILVEQANHAMDSVLWKEIYTACYGKKIDSALPRVGMDASSSVAMASASPEMTPSPPTAHPDTPATATASVPSQPSPTLDLTSGEVSSPLNTFRESPSRARATVDTAGNVSLDIADDLVPDGQAVPDPLSAALGSGVSDREMLTVVPALSMRPPESTTSLGPTVNTGDKDFLRNLTTYGAVATLRHFTQISVRAANPNSLVPYLYVHGQRDKELLFMFNQVSPASKGVSLLRQLFAFIDPFFKAQDAVAVSRAHRDAPRSRLRAIFFGRGTTSDSYAQMKRDRQREAEAGLSNSEKVAVERLQLLLRRDRVKVWDLADLTIWRPGVFRRRARQRWLEHLFTLVERPVDVNLLAECVVDDIIESIGREQLVSEARKGTVKVINSQSVSRRVHMKAIEDGLDEYDSKHGTNLASEPLLRLPMRVALVAGVFFGIWLVYVGYLVVAENE